jgi:hypothetical protein
VSTGRSIHAVPSITPSQREGIQDGPRLRARPVGLVELADDPEDRAHREFTYKLLRPDLVAKALGEKGGGLARGAEVTLEPPLPIAELDLWRGVRTKGR